MIMKKNIFKFMMIALMGFVCVTTFIACGDDDDELGQDISGAATYYEPCLDWGSNIEHVKEYMSGSGWSLSESSNSYMLMYGRGDVTSLIYKFLNGTDLFSAEVTYLTYNTNLFQYIKSETERRYNITLQKDVEKSNSSSTVYSGDGTRGQQKIYISVYDVGVMVVVIYAASK